MRSECTNYTWALDRSFSAELYLRDFVSLLSNSLQALGLWLHGCLPEELLDQIHVGHDHSAAAVSSATERVHGVTRRNSQRYAV